ncbi:MAG: SPASM domain-containing protein [Proteobacteria bacterium]|nr:SPASM domain-containing protein [Pseudomonadota bacterium]
MKIKRALQGEVDEAGRLILPEEVILRYGLQPGVQVSISEEGSGIHVNQPVTHLSKVYIEPTTHCNLNCCMCIRNTWDEPLGQMTESTFDSILKSLRAFSPPPTVIFGGFGEPLSHPRIAEMVAAVKELSAPVELITNATVLTKDLSRHLIEAGLDVLWVSLDAATAEAYGDVRLGAILPQVIANVACFRDMPRPANPAPLHMGIVFVAMKRNIADLPAVMRLGRQLGADRFMLTNILPYSHELTEEVLYARSLSEPPTPPSPMVPHLNLSRIDINEETRAALSKILSSTRDVHSNQSSGADMSNSCPFIKSGSTAVCWDGSVSPCLPLLHSHTAFIHERKRFSRRHVIGNVNEHDLQELWNTPEYVALRERVQAFDFSPCVFCGGCNLSQTNEEDCIGNTFPTCGGCLWAQGVIQCP